MTAPRLVSNPEGQRPLKDVDDLVRVVVQVTRGLLAASHAGGEEDQPSAGLCAREEAR